MNVVLILVISMMAISLIVIISAMLSARHEMNYELISFISLSPILFSGFYISHKYSLTAGLPFSFFLVFYEGLFSWKIKRRNQRISISRRIAVLRVLVNLFFVIVMVLLNSAF